MLVAAWSVPAAADSHGAVAAGGLFRIDSPSLGVWGAAELWPGGLWGARADIHATSGPILVEGSVARALGATWRHLVVSVHAGAGADLDRSGIAIAAGLATELGLFVGPLALATDLTVHAIVWDGRDDLVVTVTLGVAAVF
jgi:hypothetical protein